ncbi:HlyD family secretion protein [Oxalobacter formigenes]|uniref:efflux RND transporter periplasmic adaptor subunit n=1 Tax=Oxalobacter formigenes TaxID=847 RepID=UPI0002D823B4|nr:HlyD family secretion protein [Oxalobacter formigenes]ARQ45901.1 p-hydroxybenzoic acid efflux pump subunit AaeA [Oxalobacter formigenes]ARQ78119.1 efflux transporter periplasmic adaptor subunit [Oxalobacter formigenes OXCC13]MCZ4062191.1 HlyD family secretion protein [Oxalobacter formigenes]QDX33336.1 HlyD family secretion protein [Oxalobacter formigenes]WAW00470.1 HlyD family secretion protein [Oxalobacter formigenes]
MFSKISLNVLRRYLITILVVLVALFIGWRLWIHYENDPWTRDGRIKADVVQVAPDVTGQVVKINVKDNQQVNVGDVLFEIDPARFDLALRQAKAAEEAAKVTLAQAIRESNRNRELKDLVAAEVTEQGQSRVEEARAALLQAVVNRDKAQLDLDRTKVLAAVDGTVTNLDLRTGSYVTASKPVMALVDRHSYYAEGYFEETKLPNIEEGNRATIKLMSSDTVLEGHVQSVSRGIADRERTTGSNLLQNINPAFNWVRLVQRIPVRVEFDNLPKDTKLVAGQTVTIEVFPSENVKVATNDKTAK